MNGSILKFATASPPSSQKPAGKHAKPATFLPAVPIRPEDGWCEDPADRHYNQHVKVPAASTADRLTLSEGDNSLNRQGQGC